MPVTPTLADPGADEEVSSITNTVLKAVMVIVILGLVGFWAWIFAGGPKRANPDRLAQRAFVERTGAHCDTMLRTLDTLPPAQTSKTAGARADVVDRATAAIATMVDRIAADAPRTGDDARRVNGWIGDWRTYLSNRRDYTRRLRKNPRAQLYFDRNPAGDPIDGPIKIFAQVNDLPQCFPPGDIG
ncbi:MAG: hypothetical protein JWM05_3159 [Acidimicrobiales bacterium]|nr:hypothetical protein [Acidimicrobiales bacterium]